MTTKDLFSLDHSLAGEWLEQFTYTWETIPFLTELIGKLSTLLPSDYHEIEPSIWVGRGTIIDDSAQIQGPTIIGHKCRIRHNAFIRPNVLIGSDCIIGNSSEIKNSILFDDVQVPHFNYVGDSVLGYGAHLGAGAILSNFKATGDEINAVIDQKKVPTGLKKFGALLGDRVEIGSNAVLYPGTIIGPDSIIYPLQGVRGTIEARHIQKANGSIVPRTMPEMENK